MILIRNQLRLWLRRTLQSAALLTLATLLTVWILWLLFPFPIERLRNLPESPVITDRTGRVLLELVGTDDQWREPVGLDSMSHWLIDATIAVEDARFHEHTGIDPLAVVRAAGQNIMSGSVQSGASTLTMQICRMMDNRPRTWRAKLVESFRALQLETIYTKDEIIETYLNLAPYGGNIRGVEAASRIYFAKSAMDLTLSEASLLAGLPKGPSIYRPDRFIGRALERRSVVLQRMLELNMITAAQYDRTENDQPIIQRTIRAGTAFHAAWMALNRRGGGGSTTIDAPVQREVERLCEAHRLIMPGQADLAVVVLDVQSAAISALVGSADIGDPVDGQVNGAIALRSPGSALKPFIYAAAFEAKRLLPESMVHDVPIHRSGWSPRNFDSEFLGEMSATDALRQSRNVPAILIAEAVGVDRCAGLMRACGIRIDQRDADRAGLAIATGGVEVSLLDITNAYATIARDGQYRAARLLPEEPDITRQVLDPDICRALNQILSTTRRTPASGRRDDSWFMWKTGTSSGRRDAWAVGHNGRYAVGVWIGRFDGRGDARFSGADMAEPLLAAIFNTPLLRSEYGNETFTAWSIARPIPPPIEMSKQLTITQPADSSTFYAIDEFATIFPIATQSSIMWFVDGRGTDPDAHNGFRLPRGVHELRCINQRGESASVSVTVK